jgi:RHS repeat-associated protein
MVWATRYFHFEAQGSTVELTDSLGGPLESYRYDAYGTVQGMPAVRTCFTFVGQHGYCSDSQTTDFYVRARTYSSETAQFNSRDPLNMRDGSSQYMYAHSNPMSFIDPSGELHIHMEKPEKSREGCGDPKKGDKNTMYAVAFSFSLDKPAPCAGYFVQQVWVRRRYYDCPKCPAFYLPSFTFYEAWAVDQGDTQYKRENVFAAGAGLKLPDGTNYVKFTDKIEQHAPHGTCGHLFFVGTVKFYCSDPKKGGTGDLGDINRPPTVAGWGSGPTGPIPEANGLPSRDGSPGDSGRPEWWNKAPVEGPGQTMVTMSWCCCGGPSSYVHTYASVMNNKAIEIAPGPELPPAFVGLP